MTLAGLAALCLTLSAGAPQARAETSRPDIIVVMVDDLGVTDTRILDRLPHIKAVWLDNGLEFTSYYNETPLCCPGRAGFLTAQHTRHHHVNRNDARLLDPTNTVATALHDAGYQTAVVGKYLNHAELLADPTPPGWDRVALSFHVKDTPEWIIDGVRSIGDVYADRVTAQESAAFVASADHARPLFLWSTPHAPHYKGGGEKVPWLPRIEPTYASDARCAGIEQWHPPGYSYARQPLGWPLDDICRSLLTVDDMVGDLQAAVAARGRPAVWVFTSDNGMAWGWHGFPMKNVPESGRTPLYIAGGHIVHGTTDALQSNIDLGPTLAQLGGGTMPWADGQSFLPLLYGATGGRTWMLEDHPRGAATYGSWRGGWRAIRTPVWYLLYRKAARHYYLFDLVNDPWMDSDVAAQQPSIVRLMRRLLSAAIKSV